METVFLIGGSGFIGKNLARYLYNRYTIYIYDKYIDRVFFSDYPAIHTFSLDLVAEHIPLDTVSPDYIINLASVVTAERDLSLFDALISTNLKILLNLYERFKEDEHLKLFIQFGSSEEYGSEGSPFIETMREKPNSPYALVKQLTTNTSLMLCRNYNFPVMVVRPGNLFGPMQDVRKFIPYVIARLKNNEVLQVSPCEQKRDFIYVDDFAEAIEKLLINYKKTIGKIVNVSWGESISLKEIIEICRTYISSSSPVQYGALPYRENEVMDLTCDITLLSELTGLKMNGDIKKSLKEII